MGNRNDKTTLLDLSRLHREIVRGRIMRDWEEIKQLKRVIWANVTDDGAAGFIKMPCWQGSIIVSTGAGWEHVSVSPDKKRIIPSWDDMVKIKDMFWTEEEAVIQIHPPKADYVNNMPNCLHLWRCTHKEMVLPPRILVGITRDMTAADVSRELREAFEIAGEKYDG